MTIARVSFSSASGRAPRTLGIKISQTLDGRTDVAFGASFHPNHIAGEQFEGIEAEPQDVIKALRSALDQLEKSFTP